MTDHRLCHQTFQSQAFCTQENHSIEVLRLLTSLSYDKQVVHVTADGFSHMFALVCLLLGIPVVGSFHTDLQDLLATHNAMGFQSFIVGLKERLDSIVLNSCATTSLSFAVS